MLAACCGVCIAGLSGAAVTQAQDGKVDLKPQIKTLMSADGLTLHLTYWPSEAKQDAAVIVLLHMQNGNRLDWPAKFVLDLQQQGYAVIAVDLRGHGQSKGTPPPSDDKDKKKKDDKGATVESDHFKPGDYEAMVLADMEAVKEFIYEEHQAQHLNMNKMAIIAADMGTSVAICFAANDWLKRPHPDGPAGAQTPRGQDVRALVLVSPQSSVPGLPVTKPVRTLKAPEANIAFLVCVGSKDKTDRGQAKKLYTSLATPDKNKDRMFFEEYGSPKRGTDLFGTGLRMEDHILAFLDKYVKKLPSDWRDRESRVGKKRT
jgi:pimeloyl-ACP methyl ester carboxylesterase